MVTSRDLSFVDKEEADKYLQSLRLTDKYQHIAGLDECGRGPMAGPVVAACVLLPQSHTIKGIKDSKKLSAKKRQDLTLHIMEQGQWGIGVCEHEIVDSINVYQATLKAAKIAVGQCHSRSPIDHLLCDGGLDIQSSVPFTTTVVIKGDLWFECIGAASIVAKVFRDAQMSVYHDLWPEYGFNTNQGYGTKVHIAAIKNYGLSPIHRRTFGICRGAKERVTR